MFDLVILYVACMIINVMICKIVVNDEDERIYFILCGCFSCVVGIVAVIVKLYSSVKQHMEYSSKCKNSTFLIEQFNKLIG